MHPSRDTNDIQIGLNRINSGSFYYPKASKTPIPAGLLACPRSDAFPLWAVAIECRNLDLGLTAAVSAPDFHRIPFSPVRPEGATDTEIGRKDKELSEDSKKNQLLRNCAGVIPVWALKNLVKVGWSVKFSRWTISLIDMSE